MNNYDKRNLKLNNSYYYKTVKERFAKLPTFNYHNTKPTLSLDEIINLTK